jgi:hypothetical protein
MITGFKGSREVQAVRILKRLSILISRDLPMSLQGSL